MSEERSVRVTDVQLRTYNLHTARRYRQPYKVSSYTSHGTTVVELGAESVTRGVSDRDKVN